MKFKNNLIAGIFIVIFVFMTGCVNTSQQDTETTQPTTEAPPTLSEEEAKSRALDALKDKVTSLRITLPEPFVYEGIITYIGEVEAETLEYENDIYTIHINGNNHIDCYLSTMFSTMDCVISPYILEYRGNVTVYSNGDTHIDDFHYDVVENEEYDFPD